MSKFAKGNNSKNAKGNNLEKIIYKIVFKNFQQVVYSFSAFRCLSLKLLAVIVFEISSFLCLNFHRAITKKKSFLKF